MSLYPFPQITKKYIFLRKYFKVIYIIHSTRLHLFTIRRISKERSLIHLHFCINLNNSKHVHFKDTITHDRLYVKVFPNHPNILTLSFF